MRLRATRLLMISNGEGAAFVPWTPAILPGLDLWLDASDSTTLQLTGSSVDQWDDKSGNANNVAQLSSTKRPVVVTGPDGVSFDGSNDQLDAASSIITASFADELTLFSASTLDAGSETGHMYGAFDIATGTSLYQQNGVSIGLTNSPSGATANLKTHGITGRGLFGAVYNNQVLDLSFDGNIVSANYAYTFPAPGAGVPFILGNRSGGSTVTTYWEGVHHEVIVLNRALSVDERQKLEGYLAWKWGLEEELPLDHPYRFDGSIFGYGSVTPLSPSGSDLLITSDGDVFIVQG